MGSLGNLKQIGSHTNIMQLIHRIFQIKRFKGSLSAKVVLLKCTYLHIKCILLHVHVQHV